MIGLNKGFLWWDVKKKCQTPALVTIDCCSQQLQTHSSFKQQRSFNVPYFTVLPFGCQGKSAMLK